MGKKKAGTFVLDCSVAVAWFFEDEADAYAESVEDAMASASAVVPSLWRLEVANALLVGERRRRAPRPRSRSSSPCSTPCRLRRTTRRRHGRGPTLCTWRSP